MIKAHRKSTKAADQKGYRSTLMEELHELRTYIEQGHYDDALNLIGEMEEMSKDDKINRRLSYFLILQMHLIKQQAENRTTRSWNQ